MCEQKSSTDTKKALVDAARQELVGTALRRHPAVGVAAAVVLPMLRFIARCANQTKESTAKRRGARVDNAARDSRTKRASGKGRSIKRASNNHQEGRPMPVSSQQRTPTVPRDLSIRAVQTASVSINRNEKGAAYHG